MREAFLATMHTVRMEYHRSLLNPTSLALDTVNSTLVLHKYVRAPRIVTERCPDVLTGLHQGCYHLNGGNLSNATRVLHTCKNSCGKRQVSILDFPALHTADLQRRSVKVAPLHQRPLEMVVALEPGSVA